MEQLKQERSKVMFSAGAERFDIGLLGGEEHKEL